MTVKEIFKELFVHSVTKNNPVWELNCDWNEDSVLAEIEHLMQTEFIGIVEHYKLSEKINAITHAVFDEIIDLRRRCDIPEYEEKLAYLQLNWGVCASSRFNCQGEFLYCYGIFNKSLFETIPENGEQQYFDTLFLYRYMFSQSEYLRNSIDLIDEWLHQLFYYSKSFSGLSEWCNLFYDALVNRLIVNPFIPKYYTGFLSTLLSWGELYEKHDSVKKIKEFIQLTYDGNNWTSDVEKNKVKAEFGLSLLMFKNYHTIEQKELIYSDLKNSGLLHSLNMMQAAIAISFDILILDKNSQELIDAISAYNNDVSFHNVEEIELTYNRARIFKNLLNTPIQIALTNGRSDYIENILTNYYNIILPSSSNEIIFISPNQPEGVTYCFNNTTSIVPNDIKTLLVELVDLENEIFNTVRLLKGKTNQKLVVPNKTIGQPTKLKAKIFKSKLLNYYRFDLINFKELTSKYSICQFDLNSFPIQPLMLEQTGLTFPLNLSLTEKHSFSKVERVLYWQGNSMTSEIETNAIKVVFSYSNIELIILNSNDNTKEEFLIKCNSEIFDVIWISSHGHHEHYETNKSHIVLSDTESLNIREFNSLRNRNENRRLIFLNICEGGVHSQNGEFKNIGFPNLLVDYNQDVLSHLWMVDWRISSVYGTLIGIGLAKYSYNFFESYQFSLNLLLEGKDSVLKELKAHECYLEELISRIENDESTDWYNLVNNYSPVYHI